MEGGIFLPRRLILQDKAKEEETLFSSYAKLRRKILVLREEELDSSSATLDGEVQNIFKKFNSAQQSRAILFFF